MKIKDLKPEQVVWMTMRRRMGHTMMKSTDVFSVRIIKVHLAEPPESDYVVASWNNNRPERFYANNVKHWRKDKPVMVRTTLGSQRRATRQEIKEMKEKEAFRIAGQTTGWLGAIHDAGDEKKERANATPEEASAG